MNQYYVYEWIRLDTNCPFYVGKGSGDRWRDCWSRGSNRHFINIIKSVPVVVNILKDNLTEIEAYQCECWYIHEYKYVLGYDLVNLTDGGDSPPHGSGDKNNNYGNYWSEEQKKRASERVKDSGKYKGSENPRALRIMCVETGRIYSHIKEASDEFGMKNQSSITMALKQKQNTAYGFHWCKINDDNIEHMSNECNRFLYLVESYSELKKDNNVIVCLEDSIIFKNRLEFMKYSKLPYRFIQQKCKNHETIIYNNKEYIFARDYSRII